MMSKSDNEKSRMAVKSAMITELANYIIIREKTLVRSSRSNGEVEEASQTRQKQIRTLRSALEGRTGDKVEYVNNMIPWMVAHAANIIINRCAGGKNGKTPFER